MNKRVLTFGVFDCFHYGHLRLFKRCKKYGNKLIVAIQIDEQIKINKPNCDVIYNWDIRNEIVSSLRCVDETIPYSQVFPDITKIGFDILVVGGDQNHAGFQRAIEWCRENNKEVVVLQRTPNISSTKLRGLKSK